ncbi:hypothetical protein [Saccharopolyspora spinosa]|nr:hypothetical protein [Saccharopolyspora spinosa]
MHRLDRLLGCGGGAMAMAMRVPSSSTASCGNASIASSDGQ